MRFTKIWSWLGGRDAASRTVRRKNAFRPAVGKLEDRTVMNGYLAIGAGAGAFPQVAIRVDKVNSILPGTPGNAGDPISPTSDGKTDFTTQLLMAFNPSFTGGVRTATGNFDGDFTTPDFLITAAGPGGGPHVKVWTMVDDGFGNITVGALFTEFMAYSPRFAGGVNVTTGDLDGDGRAELIVGAGAGGGPHVKIYKLDISDRKAVLVNEFMAYEPSFRGGVSVSSGQGYQVPLQVRQILGGDFPGEDFFQYTDPPPLPPAPTVIVQDFQGLPAIAYTSVGAVRPGDTTVPGQQIPLAQRFIASTGITTSFTVGSGVIQYVGANMLNNYGNIAYEPNVVDPTGNGSVPPEQPLVYASWAVDDPNRPAWAIPDVIYGPMVQDQPAVGDIPPRVTPLRTPAGQVNSRNQLITGPGVGGGPLVRIWDFTAGTAGRINLNEMAQFVAFDPNFRGGINVSIGSFIDTPTANPFVSPFVIPDTLGPRLTEVSFPFNTNIYRQYGAQIAVTPASGGGSMVIFSDFKPNPRTRRLSIGELDMRATFVDTAVVPDLSNPLGGYMGIADTTTFSAAIDPQFRGQILTTSSALLFNGSGAITLADGTVVPARAQNVFAAAGNVGGPSRGTRVRIFDNLGPITANGVPIVPGPIGTSLAHDPIDDFQAFLSGQFPTGIGGISFGFGALANPTLDIVDLPQIGVPSTVSNPRYNPPPPAA